MHTFSDEFESFLKLCDNVHNHHGQEVRKTYLDGFLPWFEAYRQGDLSLEKNLGGMVKNGLNEEEAFMILAYTGSHSSWVNSEMRNGQIINCKCKTEFIERLNNALAKIISFDNQIVFRMDSPSDDKEVILNWFKKKIGCIFKIPFFLSTAKEDYKNTEIVWNIKTLSENSLGKDISDITNNSTELEVLFNYGSCFKIDSVDFNRAYVNLIEVSSNSAVNFRLTQLYWINIK